MKASEVAGSIINMEKMIQSDEYFEAASDPIMKAGEVLNEEMEATNSAGCIFNTDEMFEGDEYFEAPGPIMKVGEVFDEVTLTE